MVEVWIVSVCVHERRVQVRVTMRLTRRVACAVLMLVVGVVNVEMRMLERFVRVEMLVVLSCVQPDSCHHAERGDHKGPCDWVPKEGN